MKFMRCLLALSTFALAGCASVSDKAARSASAPAKAVQVWLSTADASKQLTRESDLAFAAKKSVDANIEIDVTRRYQDIVGFGAAITDASAWLIEQRMSRVQREALLQDLFGRAGDGIGLSFTRLTIGASDFSRYHYSFDDMPPGQRDPQLAHFSIEPNRQDVLPVVRAALAVNPKLQVMASPWSAPGWMKTTGSMIGGTLRADAYAPFAEYLLRYVEAYAAEGVPIFALTVQNEPGFAPDDYPGMKLDASARAKLIGEHLGPLLARRAPATKIFDWDHNWDRPEEPLAVLADPVARRYVAGVAWHCYAGAVRAQTAVHDAHPDKDEYLTECSGGEWKPMKDDALLTIVRRLVIGSTRGWSRGVLLWNLALDENHGPHAGGCSDCRGLVTIDSKTGTYVRTVDYVALAHASRFVRRGAQRVESSETGNEVDNVVFRNADDGSLVMIAANSSASAQHIAVRADARSFVYEMPAYSVATFVWRQ
ncbi:MULTISPECIES: glycoside hydrolase family 30 beta sandwich domain-containing protein [unclassified Rudaea]|uniref:glycoside hydrolase family 30 protein n=1 Tax=unclassified Rudaea TaxID=2627037 RepID=UPI0020169DE4|nr:MULTISPECIES: glycoside hydrolase family 30 beta sandwich domain-containing protein [unclassified Rudaea]